MKVRNLLIAAVVLFCSGSMMAQTFGIRAGINSATHGVSFDDDPLEGYDFDFKSVLKFHVGAVVELPVAGDLSIETGLIYHGTGAKIDESAFKNQININYIQLPLSLKYRADLGTLSLFIHAGPYAAYALDGNGSTEILGVSTEEDIDFGDGAGEYNRLDFGLNGGAGIGFGPLDLGVNYGYGLADLVNLNGVRVSNQVLSVSLTYRFGAGK